jgi:hypothetical protein
MKPNPSATTSPAAPPPAAPAALQPLRAHPAWHWLRHVPGLEHGPLIRLLERLDVRRAGTPSSFWAYCGLATVPAPDGVARVAQDGHYDHAAKLLCLEIAGSLRIAGHGYERFYQAERENLDASRPDWPPARRHMTALRKMEKLFLAHLWLVWRQAEGLAVTDPYPGTTGSDPWAMTRVAARRRWVRPGHQPPELRTRG